MERRAGNGHAPPRAGKERPLIPLAILAGGRGARLGALTRRCPKSLLRAGGVPFLHYQLAWAQRQGVRRVVLCLGHHAGQIRRYLERQRRWQMEIMCSDEGCPLRGTAGALRHALSLLGRRFLALYGDSYLPVNYDALARAQARCGAPAVMAIFRNAGCFDHSNVRPHGSRVEEYMPGGSADLRWIDAGISVLTPAALRLAPRGHFCDLATVYARLAAKGRLRCWRTKQRFYEVGSRRGLEEFRALAARLRRRAGW